MITCSVMINCNIMIRNVNLTDLNQVPNEMINCYDQGMFVVVNADALSLRIQLTLLLLFNAIYIGSKMLFRLVT